MQHRYTYSSYLGRQLDIKIAIRGDNYISIRGKHRLVLTQIIEIYASMLIFIHQTKEITKFQSIAKNSGRTYIPELPNNSFQSLIIGEKTSQKCNYKSCQISE